jgi:cytosine/uracil/thiamine/allantoin permease
MKGRRNKIAIGVGLACLVGLAIALPASGHKVTYGTNLQLKLDTLNETTEQYSGKVTSTKGACIVGRTITVTQAGVPIAATVSNAAGDWAVLGPKAPKNTDITASTPKKILKKNSKHRHKCAAAATTRKAPGP